MSLHAVANRYAKSLLDLSLSQNSLDTTMKDMDQLKEGLKNNDLKNLMKSPIIKADKKLGVYRNIFGTHFGKLSNAFVELLIKKGRENYIPQIIDEFKEQVRTHRGVSKVRVSSASPMSEELLNQIRNNLSKSSSTLSHVEIETAVDDALIGGSLYKLEINFMMHQ